MRIIGVDLHTRQQSVAMLDTDTGEVIEKTLEHEGDEVREFYSALPGPVLVGIEATGSMPWFLKLMEELKIECRVGHPAKVRAAEARKQKHDRRDARLLLNLLAENRFPAIWIPRPSNAICARYYGIVTSGYGCELECNTHCSPWPWRTVCDAAPLSGAK